MGTRLDLHNILCDILKTSHVYFQPPESIRMVYPAIVYTLDNIDSRPADNIKYLNMKHYMVQYISRDPDNTVVDTILKLPYSSFDRRFEVDNLYHDCIALYF